MKKLIDIPEDLLSVIGLMPGTFTFNVQNLLRQVVSNKLPIIYDIKNIDLSKMIFLIIMNDFNYVKEKSDQDNMIYHFSRQYSNSKIEISFFADFASNTVEIHEENVDIDSTYTTFNRQIILSAIKSRINFSDLSKLKLLTISDKIKAVPGNWADDEVFMSLFEKNYLNNL